MKKVFRSASNVIHVFCQRTQSEGRSSNVFFEHDKIYSYGHHYLLGEFITNKKNEIAIFINDRGYSSTTSQHISWLSSGSRQYKQFYAMSADSTQVLNQLKELKNKLYNARKPGMYISEAQRLMQFLNDFISWRGGKTYQEKQDLKQIKELEKIFDSENYKDALLDLAKKQANKAKREEAKRRAKARKDLEKFFNYELNRVNGLNEDFLRLSKDKKYIETTQNLKVCVNKAKTLYSLIAAGKDIHGYQIEHYTVIGFNGVLRIGCHNINIDNMHKVGKQIIELKNI